MQRTMATNSLWLDAFSSSSAQLKSDYGVILLALDDLAGDGCDRLAALVIGQPTLLKIIKGPDLEMEIVLNRLASTMCTFHWELGSAGTSDGGGNSYSRYLVVFTQTC